MPALRPPPHGRPAVSGRQRASEGEEEPVRVGRAGVIICLAATLGWAVWLLTFLGVPPTAPGAQAAFYCSLLLALSMSGAVLLALGSRPKEARRAAHGTAYYLPHTLLASFLLLFALWLQSLRMLTLPNGLLLFALFVLIEGAYNLASRRLWSD